MKTFITALIASAIFATSTFGFAITDARDTYLEEAQKPFEGVRGKLVRQNF